MVETTHQPWDLNTKSRIFLPKQTFNLHMGLGGGLVVSVVPFYSNDSTSDPTEEYHFMEQQISCKRT